MGVKGLVGTAFLLALSLMLTIFACVLLEDNKNAWPLLPWIFYIFVPVPAIACIRKSNESLFSSNDARIFGNNMGYFLVGLFAASGPSMVFVQYHTEMISLGAMFLCIGSTVLLAASGALLGLSIRKPQDHGFD